MDFKGKNVLITGASRGLGESLAREFAREGANLILIDRNDEPFEKIASDLSAQSCTADCYKVDVTDQASIDELFAQVQEKYGFIDVIVNNAGILNSGGFHSTFTDFERMMNVNVMGYARMIMTFLPILGRPLEGKKANFKRGMIILISSIGGLVIAPNLQFYGISKASTIAMAIALRQHFAITNQKYMQVLDIRPPQFDTQLYVGSNLDAWIQELRASGKLPTPDKFAALIVKAAKKGGGDVNLTLLGKFAAFGVKFFPGLVLSSSRRYYFKSQNKEQEKTKK